MARIFISHSSRNNDAADRMKAWLASQGFENAFLDKDKTTGIPPGADWEKTLYREVDQSQAVIILQTPDWLASKWCFAEFTQARALGKAIFPVIETPANGARIAPDIQALNLTSDREGGLERLKRELVRIALDTQGGFKWDASRPPFPGLLAFQEEDAAIYFGRDDDIRRLIERLEARRAQGGTKLIALLGSSGSGKSSLLRAGVVPRLKGAGRNWIVTPPIRPSKRPVIGLAQALANACGRPEEWSKLRGCLLGPHRARALDDLANNLRAKFGTDEAQILIPIDQAEELFGVSKPAEARRFFKILSLLQSENLPFIAVIALRSDFLGQLQSAPSLTARFEEFSLAPMPLARIPQIIHGPARVAGLSVEEAFVQQAARDAETEDALPLLAFALRELLDWPSKNDLSLERYKALGDKEAGLTPLENAVRKAADKALDDEPKPTSDELAALREAFVPAMVRVNDEGQYARRPARLDSLPVESHSLLKRLENVRLLSRPKDDAGAVEVAHEALLRKWPLLRSWLDAEREFLIGKQQLEQDLRDWEQAPDTDKAGALLTGLKLTRAGGWLVEHPMRLTAQEREFVRVSAEHAEARLKAERDAALERDALVKAATTVVVEVRADNPRVRFATVSPGETWTFSASGYWTSGIFSSGPDGLRNFLADALEIEPPAAGYRWLQLMGEIEGQPGSTFPIGAACTKTFSTAGELVIFANDAAKNYVNNKGLIQLRGRLGGGTPVSHGTALDLFLDTFGRIQGIPVIATLVLALSFILVFTRQGQDLLGGIGEDDFWQFPDGLLQIAFALSLLFLAFQAWGWSRLIILSNYGADRSLWRPSWFLLWLPRVLGVMPFAAAAIALTMNPNSNTFFVMALLTLGTVFLTLVVRRQDISGRLAKAGATRLAHGFQRSWVVFSLVMAGVAMIGATLWPVQLGVSLGAPAVVFIGLGFIIPVIAVTIQMAASLRIPVIRALLVAAVIFGFWNDNHAVGRRAFGIDTTGVTDRLGLKQAYELWRSAQPGGPDGKKVMILVAAQGGASRAGYWTALALSALREAAQARGVDFDKHLFAISSVSGGSVGSVGYAAMLRSAADAPDFNLRLLRFAGQNVLGAAMIGLLFPDLLQRFLPVAILPDRAETQERSWEEAWASIDPSARTAPLMRELFLNLAPKAGQPWRPILIIQGTSENSGRRVLTSGVKFDCNEVDADDFLDSFRSDVAASTAILNGARFPWYSPAGTFQASRCGIPGRVEDHIVEGGYFDSAGAETLREVALAINAIRAQAGEADPLRIIFVLIGYRDQDTPEPTPALAINDVFAPLFSTLSSISAHQARLLLALKQFGQTGVGDRDPYTSRFGSSGAADYAAIVLCKGEIESAGQLKIFEPPNWNLSGLAKRYIENSVIATTPACNAAEDVMTINAIVDRLKR